MYAPTTKPTYADFARQATVNPNSKVVVLGKYNKNGLSYDRYADKRSFTYFHLEQWDELEGSLGRERMWHINKAFLQEQINQGKSFKLINNPNYATGYYKQEVDYLKSMNYNITKHGRYWQAIA